MHGGDSPNKLFKLFTKKIWHLIGQLVHLGQPHNIVDDVSNLEGLARQTKLGPSLARQLQPLLAGARD